MYDKPVTHISGDGDLQHVGLAKCAHPISWAVNAHVLHPLPDHEPALFKQREIATDAIHVEEDRRGNGPNRHRCRNQQTQDFKPLPATQDEQQRFG